MAEPLPVSSRYGAAYLPSQGLWLRLPLWLWGSVWLWLSGHVFLHEWNDLWWDLSGWLMCPWCRYRLSHYFRGRWRAGHQADLRRSWKSWWTLRRQGAQGDPRNLQDARADDWPSGWPPSQVRFFYFLKPVLNSLLLRRWFRMQVHANFIELSFANNRALKHSKSIFPELVHNN